MSKRLAHWVSMGVLFIPVAALAGGPDGMALGLSTSTPVDTADTTALQPATTQTMCTPDETLRSYHLSVDGQPVSSRVVAFAGKEQRCPDVSMADSDVQLEYNGMNRHPMLNITATPSDAVRHQPVTFTPYANYPAFIKKWEIRIYKVGVPLNSQPLALVESKDGRDATWTPDDTSGGEVRYLLRVGDDAGHFDETESKRLVINEKAIPSKDQSSPEREKRIGYGENHLVTQNIPLNGGLLTAHGKSGRAGRKVMILGREVPTDPGGRFVAEFILPNGTQAVDIALQDGDGEPVVYHRTLYTPQNEWFYVALGDLVVGENHRSGPAALVTADNDHYDDKVYVDGRTAFYLKGKIKGQYLITASADTQEAPARDLFTNFSDKDPRSLLRRIDPTKYYPVYGDDSTTIEDAPTQGKFYVRLERGQSNLMWGNFETHITGTDLGQIDRGLYGARAHLVTEKTTSSGEKISQLDAFSAQPGTLSSREEFLGTGGSLYYLRHQDITSGSERLRTEVRDKDSGLVLQTTDLVASQDYDVDYIQGRILLRQALASVAADGRLVYSGDQSGNPVYLVARYEYAPGLTPLNDMSYGGRATQWVGDHVRLGVTGNRDSQEGVGDQNLIAGDLALRYKPGTYVKGEFAQTEGPGPGATISGNGGYGFGSVAQDVTPDIRAQASRIEGSVQLQALLASAPAGTLSGYWQHRAAGFSAPGQLTLVNTKQWGTLLNQSIGRSALSLKYDEIDQQSTSLDRTLDSSLTVPLTQRWSAGLGVRNEHRDDRVVVASTQTVIATDVGTGNRTDGSLRLTYTRDRWSAYAQGQGTAEKDADRLRNDRYGSGGALKLTNRLSLTGDASAGSGQIGSKVGTDFRYSDRTDLYINYLVESDRGGEIGRSETGSLVTGARSRYSDIGSVFGEERWVTGTGPSGLTHSYGTDLSPTDRWTFGLTGEKGTLSNPTGGALDRTAGSFTAGYHYLKVKWVSVVEGRYEDSGTDVRHTWLFRNDLAYQMNPSWRALVKFNLSRSVDTHGDFYDGNFTEAVLGLGYRPVENDKLNMLFKYTYFYNLASPGQISDAGNVVGDTQRSHVLSVDETYDLWRWISVGSKYAFRLGRIRQSRDASEPFYSSTAHLGIVHADWHVIKQWDALAEWRLMHVVEAQDTRQGALLGIYRYLNGNVKLGAGYNFTNFSDDLTDLSFRSHGWFINLVAAL